MSIASKLTKLQTDISNAYESIETKGGTIPQNKNTENLSTAIQSITTGDGSSLNIFVQTTEPEVKKGIWLQTNRTPEHYTYDKDAISGATWLPDGTKRVIPFNVYDSAAVQIGTDIYLLGGNSSKQANYKYNTLTDTYTQMTNIPFQFVYGSATAVGTDIYIFGGNYDFKKAYKYNTLTDTYTRLTDIPYNFYNGGAIAIGTDIYILGGAANGTGLYNYKYNTLNNTYTQMTNIPIAFSAGSSVSVGTDIYMLGGYKNNRMNYKYNTLTNSYTQLTSIPYNYRYGSAVSIGTDIYLLGDETNYTNNYKYDTLTNTYTQLTSIPYSFYEGSAAVVNNNIYCFGGANDSGTKVQVFAMQSKTYSYDDLVVVKPGTTYETELYSNEKDVEGAKYSFDDAWYYTQNDGLITNIPTYYGNGTSWIKFKN